MPKNPNVPDIASLVQKAVYLGIGIADYAAEQARVNLQELRQQALKLADDMVSRGEMSVEEARKYVDDIIHQAQQQQMGKTPDTQTREPRPIQIVTDEEDESTSSQAKEAEDLRQQVKNLEEELQRIKRE